MQSGTCSRHYCSDFSDPNLSNCCSVECETILHLSQDLSECQEEINSKNKVIESLFQRNEKLNSELDLKNKIIVFLFFFAFSMLIF